MLESELTLAASATIKLLANPHSPVSHETSYPMSSYQVQAGGFHR